MPDSMPRTQTPPKSATAALVLGDGTVFWGQGVGAEGSAVGEVCFNTSLAGYQEIMTDPSYAGQIITFTFPHIGNVGTNDEDIERQRRPRAVVCSGRISPIRLIGVPCGITMSGFAAMAYPELPASTRADSRGVSAISVRPMPRYAMPLMVNSRARRHRRLIGPA